MSFHDLGLGKALLRAIAREGYTHPTPIQAKAIPAVLAGQDVLAAAQTGTGKTAAFMLPLLERLSGKTQAEPRVLVLTPTRELAAQVSESVRTYASEITLKTTVVFGGVGYQPQVKAFRRGVDIIVATPGRLLDHLQQGNVDLAAIETLVLDEGDRMLDMGFIHDIKRIIQYLPARRQNLLFSATFSKDIRKLAAALLDKPTEIDVAPRNATAERIDHRVVFVERARKRALLSHLIGSGNWRQVLVFTRTKHGANRLVKQLDSDGLSAAALHGNKSQTARTKALGGFKSGKIRVLVATDIAARGIDIDHLPHVVNFDLPHVAEDYVHRIGRTGRAGSEGEALSLVGPDERKLLKGIERLIGGTIERMQVAGIDLRNASEEPESRPARHDHPTKAATSNSEKPRNQRNRRRKRRPRNRQRTQKGSGHRHT